MTVIVVISVAVIVVVVISIDIITVITLSLLIRGYYFGWTKIVFNIFRTLLAQ